MDAAVTPRKPTPRAKKEEDTSSTKPRSQIQAEYFARLKQSGYKKVTVWLPPEAVDNLQKLRQAGYRSNEAAMTRALDELVLRAIQPRQDERDQEQ